MDVVEDKNEYPAGDEDDVEDDGSYCENDDEVDVVGGEYEYAKSDEDGVEVDVEDEGPYGDSVEDDVDVIGDENEYMGSDEEELLNGVEVDELV